MKEKIFDLPSSRQIEDELKRVRYRQRYRGVLRSTIYTLITVAAVAVLVATLLMPVLQIFGSSMTPTLEDGEIVLSLKTSDFQHGDVVAFCISLLNVLNSNGRIPPRPIFVWHCFPNIRSTYL